MNGWQEIVHQYGPVVRRIACRLLGNDADAADCVQEVFISVIRSYRPGDVRNWPGLLSKMATCRALDMLRQRLRQTAKTSQTTDWTAVPCSRAGPDKSAENRELAARLRRLLPQLPPQQAEVFCLAHLEDLGHDEIAQQLGITPGNVRVLLHRARARLRKLLAAPETAMKI